MEHIPVNVGVGWGYERVTSQVDFLVGSSLKPRAVVFELEGNASISISDLVQSNHVLGDHPGLLGSKWRGKEHSVSVIDSLVVVVKIDFDSLIYNVKESHVIPDEIVIYSDIHFLPEGLVLRGELEELHVIALVENVGSHHHSHLWLHSIVRKHIPGICENKKVHPLQVHVGKQGRVELLHIQENSDVLIHHVTGISAAIEALCKVYFLIYVEHVEIAY